ncbi:hypothetical protein ALT_3194 [Aspergillus lentulus]|uniref:Uncharacterized protein n=1 Tax=Aspergillus lentulus TaxID=293939 RepID=A0AAN4T964_ASPLE|nr:hypothetical protein CNMCM6069_003461 [Aspergillus lentulus]GAQ05873.1 hypothetical protein ALT_3194 [Aspergillus lentulus]
MIHFASYSKSEMIKLKNTKAHAQRMARSMSNLTLRKNVRSSVRDTGSINQVSRCIHEGNAMALFAAFGPSQPSFSAKEHSETATTQTLFLADIQRVWEASLILLRARESVVPANYSNVECPVLSRSSHQRSRRRRYKESLWRQTLTTIWAEADTTAVDGDRTDEALQSLREFLDFITTELDRAYGIL